MIVPYAIYRYLFCCTTKGHVSFIMLLSDKNYRNFELATHKSSRPRMDLFACLVRH